MVPGAWRAGPRRADPDRAARVTKKIFEFCRSARPWILTWAAQRILRPSRADRWDAFLFEFKNDLILNLTLGKLTSKLLGVLMTGQGNPRLGLVLIVQGLGSRPLELMKRLPEDSIVPGILGENINVALILVALGPHVGTKLERPQETRNFPNYGDFEEVLEDITRDASSGTPLFFHGLAQYLHVLMDIKGSLGLFLGKGPHGPRASRARVLRADGFTSE